jgi:hypothetical protein
VARLVVWLMHSYRSSGSPTAGHSQTLSSRRISRNRIDIGRRDEEVCMNTLCVGIQTESFVGRVGHRSALAFA